MDQPTSRTSSGSGDVDKGEELLQQSSSSMEYPLSDCEGLVQVIHDDKIDLEEEARFYAQFDRVEDNLSTAVGTHASPPRSIAPPSVLSNEIWFEDDSVDAVSFARGVIITGWVSVGDKLAGAYIVYDCAIRTSQNTTIHIHKRYSAFDQLYNSLMKTLPEALRRQVPSLPPKSPWAKYRSAFLEKRRRMLQQWLSFVLLHPEIGGSPAVRKWIMG